MTAHPVCRRPWPLHRVHSALDVAVTRCDPVIAVAAGSPAAPPRQATLGLQFPECGWIPTQAISNENAREPIVGIGQCFLQKLLGCFAIRCFGEEEIDCLAMAIDGPDQAHPISSNPNKRLIWLHISLTTTDRGLIWGWISNVRILGKSPV